MLARLLLVLAVVCGWAVVFAKPVSLPNFVPIYLGGMDKSVTSMAFMPDGRMLFSLKNGTIYLVNVSAPEFRPTVYFTFTNVNAMRERGVLDIKLHPLFSTATPHIFVSYTRETPRRLHVGRLTHGFTTNRGSALLDIWVAPGFAECCHIGGSISFGPDNHLYLTTGDNTNASTSADLGSAFGKVLRMDVTGQAVAGNAGLADGPGGRFYDWVWAWGLRNPYRASWDLPTQRFFIGDVGGNVVSSSWEDIFVGVAGANYGWPSCEGPCFSQNPAQSTNCQCASGAHVVPTYSYPQGQGRTGGCIIGGLVYRGQSYPAEYIGTYFFADYIRFSINFIPMHPTLPRTLSSAPPLHPPEFLSAVNQFRVIHLVQVSVIHKMGDHDRQELK